MTRALRARLGLTQEQLAAILGVHRLTISGWERGSHEPSTFHAAIVRALEPVATRALGDELGAELAARGPIRALHRALVAAYTN